MTEIVGIRFTRGGKTYYFSPGELELPLGSWAVVETARGQECGEVSLEKREVEEKEILSPLKPVLRLATDAEIERMEANRKRIAEVYAIGQERIAAHNLDMKLIDAEFSLDGKLLFYFSSEGRVDFRNLVRDLASIFHTRIELRQIGVRDEARMLGGLGPCGRGVCCREFLANFQPVSIKMAKEQNLSLNPTKISGLCGRLMCCLKYEQDTYEETRKRAPKQGREVMTPDGAGTVHDVNVLREAVSVRMTLPDGTYETRWYPLSHTGPAGKPLPPEVLAEVAEKNAAAKAAQVAQAEKDFDGTGPAQERPAPVRRDAAEPRNPAPRREQPAREPRRAAPQQQQQQQQQPREDARKNIAQDPARGQQRAQSAAPAKPREQQGKPQNQGDADRRRIQRDARQQSAPREENANGPRQRSVKPWKPREEANGRPAAPQQNRPANPAGNNAGGNQNQAGGSAANAGESRSPSRNRRRGGQHHRRDGGTQQPPAAE